MSALETVLALLVLISAKAVLWPARRTTWNPPPMGKTPPPPPPCPSSDGGRKDK